MTCRWFICALIAGVCCGFYAMAPYLDYYGEGSFKWVDYEPLFAVVGGLFVGIGLLIND